MKRILSLMLALLLLFFSFGCSEEPPDITEQPPADDGEIVIEEGIRRHTGHRIDHIYLTENEIHYTFVNQTSKDFNVGPYCVTLEKWENDKWSYYPLLSGDANDISMRVPAHGECDAQRTISPRFVTPGKYRLVEGYEMFYQNIDGSTRVERSDEYLYRVGYFTITEEQAALYPDPRDDLYRAGDTWQSKNVSLALLPVDQPPYLFEFALQNNGLERLVIPANENTVYHANEYRITQHVSMQRWVGSGRWAYCGWYQRFATEDAFIHPGDTFRIPLCSDGPTSSPVRYIPEDGYYCFSFTCCWEGDMPNTFAAKIFFRVENGEIT